MVPAAARTGRAGLRSHLGLIVPRIPGLRSLSRVLAYVSGLGRAAACNGSLRPAVAAGTARPDQRRSAEIAPAALRRAWQLLRDELGLDPGPALAGLEEAILGQRQEVLHRAASVPVISPQRPARLTPAPAAGGGGTDLFVGRDEELRRLAGIAAHLGVGGGARPGLGAVRARAGPWPRPSASSVSSCAARTRPPGTLLKRRRWPGGGTRRTGPNGPGQPGPGYEGAR